MSLSRQLHDLQFGEMNLYVGFEYCINSLGDTAILQSLINSLFNSYRKVELLL